MSCILANVPHSSRNTPICCSLQSQLIGSVPLYISSLQLSVLERRLRSKEEALKILKRELDASREKEERQHMEIMQLVRSTLRDTGTV